MTTEERLFERLDRIEARLERLDHIEAQLSPVSETAMKINELRNDLLPLSGQATRLLIRELEDVEAAFQLEDLLPLFKRMLQSVKDITFALNQLESVVDFVTTIEPLLKSTVPQVIDYLDDLEQRGVLRVVKSMLDIRAKIATSYSSDDMDQIGEGAVAALGLAKKFSDPQAMAFWETLSQLPSKVDLAKAKPVGPFGLIGALSGAQAREGLGILMELTRAMGALKNGTTTAAAVK